MDVVGLRYSMKLFRSLFGQKKKEVRKSLAEYQREMLISQGKQQIQKLKELGLTLPVRLA
jgi:hypothetical protein